MVIVEVHYYYLNFNQSAIYHKLKLQAYKFFYNRHGNTSF